MRCRCSSGHRGAARLENQLRQNCLTPHDCLREEGDRIIFQPVTREYIRRFRGRFKQKPGEKSVVQEHLEERHADRDRENR